VLNKTEALPDLLSLERQVCFALAVANRSVLAVYRPILEPLGLTHPQYLVMLALWEESPQTVTAISRTLQFDPATLSPLLKRLESAGLVTRSRNAEDERQLEVGLTAAGRRLRRKAERVPPAVVQQLGVELSELEELRESLKRINDAARRALGELEPTRL
jgi:DNA-binding MarR family transcriptional regulator